jgi:hypothetical protein
MGEVSSGLLPLQPEATSHPRAGPKKYTRTNALRSMAFFGSSSLTLSSSASMARYWLSIGCPFATCSDPLAVQDKRKAPRHSRKAVVSSDAEPAKRHELKTLITLVFADYAYEPLGIHFLERLYGKGLQRKPTVSP